VLVDIAAELAALVRSLAKSLIVVADDSLGNEGSEVVGRVPANTLNGKSDVGGGHVVVTDTDIGTEEISLLLGELVGLVLGASTGEAREVLLSKLNQLLVGDATGANKNHAVSSVIALDVVGQLGSGDVENIFTRAQDGAAEALVLESSGVEVIENNFLDLLLDLFGLSEDNISLALDSRLLETGVLEDVGKNVDALRNIGVEGLGEVNGVLTLWLELA
jgi:hypothetical protein